MRLLSLRNQGVMRKTNGTSPVYSHKTVQFVSDKHGGQRIAVSCFMYESLESSAGAVGIGAAEIRIREAPPRKKQTSGVVVSCHFFICIYFFFYFTSC